MTKVVPGAITTPDGQVLVDPNKPEIKTPPPDILDGATALGRLVALEGVVGDPKRGDIHIPEAYRGTPAWIVRSIGLKAAEQMPDLALGDCVIFPSSAGHPIQLGKRVFCFIDCAQILCKLNPKVARMLQGVKIVSAGEMQ